jgi:hypothetical protein
MEQHERCAVAVALVVHTERGHVGVARGNEDDFTRLSNRVAARDAQLPTGELLANLRNERDYDGRPRWPR